MRIQFRSLLLTLIFFFITKASIAARPPEQPESGPGGAEYRHTKVVKNVYGEGDKQFWIFEPGVPSPESAPLIVFNHGWGAMEPKAYIAWLEHLAKKGNIVVYPRYQAKLRGSPETYTANAITAVKDAILRLESKGHVDPQVDKFIIVGHSLGGTISANMAALAADEGLPQPKALMVIQPADPPATKLPFTQGHPSILEDYSTIPTNILMLVIIGSEDQIVFDATAKKIFNQTPQIPLANKDFITVVSDYYGEPPLVADHFSPCTSDEAYNEDDQKKSIRTLLRTKSRERIRERIREKLRRRVNEGKIKKSQGEIDTLDYYGYWKLLDALCDATFYGKNREYTLGNTSQQRYMGEWTDGTPIKELVVK